MLITYLIYSLLLNFAFDQRELSDDITGAWKDDQGVLIFTDHHFSYTSFTSTEFKYTYGGSWTLNENSIVFNYEFHTDSPEKVGTEEQFIVKAQNKSLHLGSQIFEHLDNGLPGKLEGAWLFYNRIQDGQAGNPRGAENPRKTMKILSGTRFQWIAYNTETKAFSGTGGGTYTTINGKYTENIDFFSRDSSRVGASLEFDYEIKGDEWHHSGLNSRGEPLYEIWKMR